MSDKKYLIWLKSTWLWRMALAYHKQVPRYALGGSFNPLNWTTTHSDVLRIIGAHKISSCFICRFNMLHDLADPTPFTWDPHVVAHGHSVVNLPAQSIFCSHVANLSGPVLCELIIALVFCNVELSFGLTSLSARRWFPFYFAKQSKPSPYRSSL